MRYGAKPARSSEGFSMKNLTKSAVLRTLGTDPATLVALRLQPRRPGAWCGCKRERGRIGPCHDGRRCSRARRCACTLQTRTRLLTLHARTPTALNESSRSHPPLPAMHRTHAGREAEIGELWRRRGRRLVARRAQQWPRRRQGQPQQPRRSRRRPRPPRWSAAGPYHEGDALCAVVLAAAAFRHRRRPVMGEYRS